MNHRQARILVWALITSLLPITFLACRQQSKPSTAAGTTSGGSEEAPAQEVALAWDALLDVRLRSVRTYGGGLGPEGPIQVYMYLQLNRGGSLELQTADTSNRGTYRHDGDRVIARVGGRDFTGELDPSRGVLTWDGIEFELP